MHKLMPRNIIMPLCWKDEPCVAPLKGKWQLVLPTLLLIVPLPTTTTTTTPVQSDSAIGMIENEIAVQLKEEQTFAQSVDTEDEELFKTLYTNEEQQQEQETTTTTAAR
mmetsp:Transcript_40203/g.46248  ORF Transcript_40203/g.46248 Transcript_40203/m.46248 type:complete len:109 (-) Transcript_40203:175-501(-)